MEHTKDNIIGVEFTYGKKGGNARVEAIGIDGNPITSWHNGFNRVYDGGYSMNTVLEFLNNGTWIAKNNDLTTPNKGIN